MEFRYVALIAVWTLISGPLFDVPTRAVTPARPSARVVGVSRSAKPAKPASRAKPPTRVFAWR